MCLVPLVGANGDVLAIHDLHSGEALQRIHHDCGILRWLGVYNNTVLLLGDDAIADWQFTILWQQPADDGEARTLNIPHEKRRNLATINHEQAVVSVDTSGLFITWDIHSQRIIKQERVTTAKGLHTCTHGMACNGEDLFVAGGADI